MLGKLLCDTTSFLNELTPYNFEMMLVERNLEIRNYVHLIATVDLIYDKAVLEPDFGFLYAQLCARYCDKRAAAAQQVPK